MKGCLVAGVLRSTVHPRGSVAVSQVQTIAVSADQLWALPSAEWGLQADLRQQMGPCCVCDMAQWGSVLFTILRRMFITCSDEWVLERWYSSSSNSTFELSEVRSFRYELFGFGYCKLRCGRVKSVKWASWESKKAFLRFISLTSSFWSQSKVCRTHWREERNCAAW